jgi:group I intron endonuclease
MLIIYKVTNKITEKIYIGKTANKFNKRRNQHKHSALNGNSNTYFHKAIRKYGWDNFEWEIIEECGNNDFLCEREVYWINFYNTMNNEKGYNLTNGGEGLVGFNPNEESRKKMSNSHKGVKLSEEHRKAIGEGQKGRVISEETRKKIGDAQRGKSRDVKGEIHPNSKLSEDDVVKIKELLLKRESQRKIAKMFGVTRNVITSIQKGKTWSHVIVEDFKPFNREESNFSGESNPKSKLTEQDVKEIKILLKKGKSQSDIAKMFGVSKHAISKIYLGKTWTHVKIQHV